MNDLEDLLKNKDDDLPFNPNIEAKDITFILRKMEQDSTINLDVAKCLRQWMKFHIFVNMYEDEEYKCNNTKEYCSINEILDKHHGQYS